MNQSTALKILRSGHNVFLTGPAGTGKTYVLNRFIEGLKAQGATVATTASTGIAATHLGGRTIHSWAGFGIANSFDSLDLRKVMKNGALKKRILATDVLVIDEISMLHDFQLDMADFICRTVRKDHRPFGGLQLVLCGDFFQLPPVSKEAGGGRFAIDSQVWQDLGLRVCYLSEQYRQTDDALSDILLKIRAGEVDEEAVERLKKRIGAALEDPEGVTKLFTHNANVDAINNAKLAELDGKERSYQMEDEGEEILVAALRKNCLAPEDLRLKKDAVVMFVENNFQKGYVNGTIGRVVSFDDDNNPIVQTRFGDRIVAMPTSWVIEENEKKLATVTQVPLRLAWAITVHKSQGMTLDAAEVDLSRAFTHGLGYVALSRVRSLDSLRILGLNAMAFKVSEKAREIDEKLRTLSAWAENQDYIEIYPEKVSKGVLSKTKDNNPKKKRKKKA